MTPFLALITPLGGGDSGGGGGAPSHPIFYPPYPSTGPGFPTAPIAPGGFPGAPSHPIYNPPYPSTGPGFPTAPIAPGGPPPYPSTGPGFPTAPIAPGGPPLGIWGPITLPDQSLPGGQPGPSHPWVPGGNYPPVVWDPSRPTNPIANPGDPNNPSGEQQPKVEWKAAWSPTTGWIVVGVPTGPTPTPSSQDDDQL